MQTVMPFIPKQDPEIPDCWEIKIHYVDGKVESFEGYHFPITEIGIFEFITKENEVRHFVQMTSVRRIEFDRRYTKALQIQKKIKAEKEKQDAN